MKLLPTTKKRRPGFGKTLTSALVVAVMLVMQSPFVVSALTKDQVKAFNEGVLYYNTEACSPSTGVENQPTIVIDPGHSGKDITSIDPETGLHDHDYPNQYENEEMFYVALKAKKALMDAGYGVILTKGDDISTGVSSVNDAAVKKGAEISASLRSRADVANTANADLALSLHDDHSQSWANFAQVYTQKVGLYRVGTKGKVEFKDAAVAEKSQKYGANFVKARTAAEGHTVQNTDVNFAGRAGLDPGNINQVQLYSKVPWVYNEVGGGSGPLTNAELDKYVKGIVDSVKASVQVSASSGGALSGNDNMQKIFNFLLGKGLTAVQSSAIVGNFMQESMLNPKAVNKSSGAYGVAQWLGPRLDNLKQYAASKGKPTDDLGVQLDFLWVELTGPEKASLNAIKKENDLKQAVLTWENTFERADGANLTERYNYAKTVYDKLGKNADQSGTPVTSTDSSTGTSATVTCGSGDQNTTVVNCNNPDTSGISQTRQNAVCVAQGELARWKSGAMKRGTDFHLYSQGRTENWCADFTSWIYNKAGYPADPDSWNKPAVLQWIALGKENKRWHYHSSSSNYTPKPGDLAIWDEGAHINMVTAVKGSTITIIGGNQNGNGGGPTSSAVTSYDLKLPRPTAGGQVLTSFVSPD